MVDKVDGNTLKPIIRDTVDKSSTIVTDGFGAYAGLGKEYTKHVIVNHELDEWTNGIYHTNTIEGFFSQLKRGIYGIYHSVSPKHLHRYCSEFEYRYNTRKSNEANRFDHSFLTCNRRLKYADLISK